MNDINHAEPHAAPISGPTFRQRAAIATSLASLAILLSLGGTAHAATSVGLGTDDSFAIMSGAGVTNSGPSVINGNLGTYPNPSVTGFGAAPGGTVNGSMHQADPLAEGAQSDLTTAYDNAAGQGPPNTLATELGGQTLTPGVYDSQSGTFGITGTLTLNAQGDPNAVFVFKTASTLITASASQIRMINGAQSCHVFWKVGSSATLGTSSTFAGNILALQSISLNSGVAVDGRLLARNGAVTLNNDTVTRADCREDEDGGGGGGTGGGGGNGGGGGGGDGDGGNGNGNGGGNGQGNGNGQGDGGPTVKITDVPSWGGSAKSPRCVTRGFRAHFDIRSASRMRSVTVSLDGEVVKRSKSRRFSVWMNVQALRAGRNTIRVVAVDVNGRRSVDSRQFRHCAKAAPDPDFTGRVAATS